MALMLVLLSYSSWKDEEVLMNILYRLDRSFPSPEEDEMTKLGKEVMDSIMKTVDVPHYEKAKILVDSYLKDGCLRPELALNDGLREKMRVGLTMERAIEELYNERGLNV